MAAIVVDSIQLALCCSLDKKLTQSSHKKNESKTHCNVTGACASVLGDLVAHHSFVQARATDGCWVIRFHIDHGGRLDRQRRHLLEHLSSVPGALVASAAQHDARRPLILGDLVDRPWNRIGDCGRRALTRLR